MARRVPIGTSNGLSHRFGGEKIKENFYRLGVNVWSVHALIKKKGNIILYQTSVKLRCIRTTMRTAKRKLYLKKETATKKNDLFDVLAPHTEPQKIQYYLETNKHVKI